MKKLIDLFKAVNGVPALVGGYYKDGKNELNEFIIFKMAMELPKDIEFEDYFSFMKIANYEYHRRTGKHGSPLGVVPEAVVEAYVKINNL